MYKHKDREDTCMDLHDCTATKAVLKDGILSLYFPDGFWIMGDHPDNPFKRTVRTNKARVDFHLVYDDGSDLVIHTFKKKKRRKTVRKTCAPGKFIRRLNKGRYRLEFLYPYKGYNEIKYDCCLWMDEKPYSKECEFMISTDQVTYCWNRACGDKPW